jgi:hypothetical protein
MKGKNKNKCTSYGEFEKTYLPRTHAESLKREAECTLKDEGKRLASQMLNNIRADLQNK